MGGAGVLQREIDDAGLQDGDAVARVDLDDSVHLREGDDDAALDGDCAASEAGAGAAGDDGDAVGVGEDDSGGDLIGGGGEDDSVWAVSLDGGVILVAGEILRRPEHVVLAEGGLEVSHEGGGARVSAGESPRRFAAWFDRLTTSGDSPGEGGCDSCEGEPHCARECSI